jgi:hypothetical protein
MRLTYRGASYDYNTSPLEVRESDVLLHSLETQRRCRTLQQSYPLTYRGSRYTTEQVAAALAVPASRSAQVLSYRGVKYVRNLDGSMQPATLEGVTVPNNTAAFKAISKVHKENIRRNLERRIQAAKERGDQTLVSLLEAESKELAL